MRTIETINPFTLKVLKSYTFHSQERLESIIGLADKTFAEWKNAQLDARIHSILKLGQLLIKRKEFLARTAVEEMGKTYTSAMAEIEKCAWLCEFYAKNAETILADKHIETEASESYVCYRPLGVLLTIMLWNFPYWQVFRLLFPQFYLEMLPF